MSADVLVLDIAPSVIHFKAELEDLQIGGEVEAEDIIQNLIPYLQDEALAYGNLLEYSRELGEIISGQYSPEDVKEFVYAVNELGSDIIDQLLEMVAYDDVGALWYDFHSFCGNDIVLIRSTLSKPLIRNAS